MYMVTITGGGKYRAAGTGSHCNLAVLLIM
jgi:hypothetical protein